MLVEEQEHDDTGAGYYRTMTSEEPGDVEMDDEETTPRPMKNGGQVLEDNEDNSDEGPFRTPLTLRKQKAIKPIVDFQDISEGESHAVKGKRDQDKMKGKNKVGWF